MLTSREVEKKDNVFGLSAPTVSNSIKNLARIVGKEEAEKLWINVSKKCNVSPFTEDLGDLEMVFKRLSVMEGSLGVCGKSLQVIAMTYRNLNKVQS
jgi:hypothetical protein